jgi:hypothetical protein
MDEIVGVEELLGAVAAVSPASSPQLQKSQPLYAAGLSSMPAVAPQRIGGPDSILTMTAHVNTLPIQQAVNSPLYNPNALAIPGQPTPVSQAAPYNDYNWGDGGADFPDGGEDGGDAAEYGDEDDMLGVAKKALPSNGHKAVGVVGKKLAALKTRVAQTKAGHGTVIRGIALCGDLSQSLPPGFANVVNLPPPPGQGSAPIDMTAALAAINTAMNQLQAQYQQLLAEDAQAQGVAQQFANAQDLPGQTGLTASLYTMASNIDQSLQNDAANVSAQIDALNSNLDNLNQQLTNLATQQQNYAQEVANVTAQQQVVNTPVTATPNFPGYQDPSQYAYQPPSLSYGVDGGGGGGGYYSDPFGDDAGDGSDMSDM